MGKNGFTKPTPVKNDGYGKLGMIAAIAGILLENAGVLGEFKGGGLILAIAGVVVAVWNAYKGEAPLKGEEGPTPGIPGGTGGGPTPTIP